MRDRAASTVFTASTGVLHAAFSALPVLFVRAHVGKKPLALEKSLLRQKNECSSGARAETENRPEGIVRGEASS
jgi:hypothetical protein